MDAREILTRLQRGELDVAGAADRLNGSPEPPAPAAGLPEPIAVIGLSARLPGARDADEFWSLLLDGADLVTDVPAGRWSIAEHFDPDPAAAGTTRSRWGAFIDDADAFDAGFFRMTPREAELTDPQARLFLQACWHGLENAGLRPGSLGGSRCGVYAGVMLNDYEHRIERHSPYARLPLVMQGNSNSMLAARIAYELDLRGPTATVDTACSSSLVALHQACQALWLGEADLMIAGGVTLYTTELPYVYMSGAGMLSPTGRERPFAAAADGIVPGEGCVVTVLKPLRQALADGDPVHAVIRAGGINADGRTNGITAPSGRSQAALISGVYDRFDIDPATIGYLECHGTGTPLGDPIEIGALNEVFAPAALPPASVPVGSVKSNVGHTSAAAGLTGLVKAIGVVRTGVVPPTLHCDEPNPRAAFAEGPFHVATERQTLPGSGRPRRAAVSAFGFSGTNAHLVVEQAPDPGPAVAPDRPVVVALSARTPERLDAARIGLLRWLGGAGTTASIADVAYTLAAGRDHYRHRAAWVVAGRAQLLAALAGEPVPDGPAALTAVAAAFTAGGALDPHTAVPGSGARRVGVPGYPFAADRHDVRPQPPAASTAPPAPASGLLDVLISAAVDRPLPGDAAVDVPLVVVDPIGDLAAGFPEAGSERPEAVVVRLDDPEPGALETALGAVATALTAAPRDRRCTVLLVTGDDALASGAAAFLRSLQAENPRVTGRAVLVDDAGAAAVPVVRQELAAGGQPGDPLVDRRDGGRRGVTWTPMPDPEPGQDGQVFRDGGVYLITGGAGGLGRELAQHLAGRYRARVVLCGRRSPGEVDLVPGGPVSYRECDVTDEDAVARLIADILHSEGALHGVLHAAGVLRDAYLTRKPAGAIAAVLAPKIAGAHALDRATADVPLDLFVLFSSVAAVTGNIGQTDYAFANGYLDAFASRRAAMARRGDRSGRTLAVDWPLWDGAGMSIPEPIRAVLSEETGLVPLPVPLGLATLDWLLASDSTDAAVVFHGDHTRWRRRLTQAGLFDEAPATPTLPAAPAATSAGTSGLAEVIEAVGAVTGRPVGTLTAGTTLESLALDSIMVRTLVAELSRRIGPVGPQLIYEVRDLAALAAHPSVRGPAAPEIPVPARTPTPTPTPTPAPARRRDADEPQRFAVVGLAGRYPQADDLATLWDNLLSGRDTVTDLPTDRWDDPAGVHARGHFLSDVGRFDAAYFGLSEHDAALTDPQERLWLETAWAALEDAGYAGPRLDSLTAADGRARSVGVFVGVTSSDYRLLGAERWAAGERTVPAGHYWSLANRVSYLFDLVGPSQPVDTACSSSLVALHQAIVSIRRGECAVALVGGVNLYLHPSRFRMLQQSGFLSADGRCRSFGAGGTGFGPGEGVGAVLIRPLDDAIAAGDVIHGVVLGTAVAHGGRTNGYTAPSPDAQARVIEQALERAAVDPATVTVIEAHGTGTELGDPVEVAGLLRAYGGSGHASLGSIKSALGHGESAAGVAALTKVLLQMRHGTLAPTRHAEPVNPELDLTSGRFSLQQRAEPWERLPDGKGGTLPRRAGISSFGAGGVNAHVVVEEHVAPAPIAVPGGPDLFVLSGPTPEHVRTTAARLAGWVRDIPVDPAALARTLREGRAAQPCRLAVVATGTAELADRLAGAVITDLRGTDAGPGVAGLPETAEFVGRLWANGRLAEIGRLWTTGLDVGWHLLPAGAPLVSVPGSVLLGDRLWLATAPAVALSPTVEPAPAPDEPAGEDVLAVLVRLTQPKAVGLTGPLDPARGLLDLGVDSINLMNLRYEVKEWFGLTVPLDELARSTVSDLAGRIAAHGAQR